MLLGIIWLYDRSKIRCSISLIFVSYASSIAETIPALITRAGWACCTGSARLTGILFVCALCLTCIGNIFYRILKICNRRKYPNLGNLHLIPHHQQCLTLPSSSHRNPKNHFPFHGPNRKQHSFKSWPSSLVPQRQSSNNFIFWRAWAWVQLTVGSLISSFWRSHDWLYRMININI